jgi:3-hydroxyisobutyrate dehydrogenase
MAPTDTEESATARPSVGFIGLGAMGMGMASCILAKGFKVRAHDVRSEAREAWAQKGGEWAATPAEAASGCGALVLMVVN